MQQLSPDLDFSGILLERLQVAVNCWLGSFRVQIVDSTGALVQPADRVRHTVLVHILVKDLFVFNKLILVIRLSNSSL